MYQLFRNFLVILFALLAAYLVATSIIVLGHSVIPIPEGIDSNSFESIKNNFHLFKNKHFIFPLFAHAVGTLLSAYIVSHFGVNYKFKLALGIGILYMLASLLMTFRIGHFLWIGIIEIGLYIPMSLLGYNLWKKINHKTKSPE